MSNVTKFEAGPSTSWKDFHYTHPAVGRPTRGKLFLGEPLDLRAMEISLNSMAPGVAMPFAHRHASCEEVYVFLSGKGELRVDDECLAVGEGTVVRVAPAGVRAWRNVGDTPLLYLVIQARAHEVPVRGIDDGVPAPLAPWGEAVT